MTFTDSEGRHTGRPPFNWRDHLRVHPAADQFPLLDPKALRELAEDIRENGLKCPIVLLRTPLLGEDGKSSGAYTQTLLDGRNRLDALAQLGWIGAAERPTKTRRRGRSTTWNYSPLKLIYDEDLSIQSDDLFTFEDGDVRVGDGSVHVSTIASLNVHRRHLTSEQKRELIAKRLKADPSKSDRQIAKQTKTSPTTVGKVRAEKEASGDVSSVDTRTDTKGRKQRSRKPERNKQASTPPPRDDAEATAEARKALYAAPAPEWSQAIDAANKRIWKSKVTKVELLTMLEPIQALAFKDDEGQDFVASISDGDAAALYDALESAKAVIEDLLIDVERRHESSEAVQDEDELSPEEFGKGLLVDLARNAAEKTTIALRNIKGQEFTSGDKETMVAEIDHNIKKWEALKRRIQVKKAKDLRRGHAEHRPHPARAGHHQPAKP
jgi:hypothetical protein